MTAITTPNRPSLWPSSNPLELADTTARPVAASDGPGVPNPLDPDVIAATLIDHYASNALKWGMWGNIPMSTMYSGLARLTENNYRLLQHMFPQIYDGRF